MIALKAAILAALACWLGVLGMRTNRRWPKLPRRVEPAFDDRSSIARFRKIVGEARQ